MSSPVGSIASTSPTAGAQGTFPASVAPSEETATAPLEDSLQKTTSDSSSSASRNPSDDADIENHSAEAVRLSNLAYSFYDAFDHSGDLADIGKAISTLQRAVQLTDDGDPGLPKRLGDLGIFYRERFNGSGNLTDIEAAISVQRKAVALTPEGHAHLPSQLTSLGSSFRCRFSHTGDLADIEAAISVQQRAVEHTPHGHPGIPGWYNNLGNSFLSRFDQTGDLADIEAAIAAQQRAIELTPEGDGDLIAWLNNLGNSFQSRFRRTGKIADIDEAISTQKRAVALTPKRHPYLPGLLSSLGNSLQSRFTRTGDLVDIAEAVSAQQRAVERTPEGHPDLASRLSNLGNSFRLRYDRTGDLADIEAATSALRRAVKLTPRGHANLPGRLDNLGSSLQDYFARSGDLAHIAEAIAAQQRTIALTPAGFADLPGRLSNLGSAFQSRFSHTSDLADIAEAISVQQRALESVPEDHAELPGWLNNQGNSFRLRFGRTGNLADIEAAISAQQKAVMLTPLGSAELPNLLNNLGVSLEYRFRRTRDLSDIAEATAVQRRAVELTPEDHADLPSLLNSLGSSLQSRYGRNGGPAVIAEAIAAQQRAVELTPKGHAGFPSRLDNLSRSYILRFEQTAQAEDLDASISCVRSAATSSFGAPQSRLQASRDWARILNLHNPLSPDVLTAFETAIHLLALVAGLEQTVKGRYAQLQNAVGIALDGAAAACRLDRPDKAVEWLEQGRCLVWNQLNNLRTPLNDLQAHDSHLAHRLAEISRKLESAASTRNALDPSMDMAAKISVHDEASAHLALAREWDEVLTTVRSIPGFESFLLPSPCSTLLQNLPGSGVIVVINVSKQRCDAIALSAGRKVPLHIPLPSFSLEKANTYQRDLSTQLQSKGIRMRDAREDHAEVDGGRAIVQGRIGMKGSCAVHNILRGLWNEVVKPILDALNYPKYDASAGGTIPRIWWCPTGIMSFLPIHAAGIYSGNSPESLLDYAVSSYTPTVTALTNRVKNRGRPIDKTVSGLFLTSQPKAPGVPEILETVTEVRDIYDRAHARGARALKVEGDLTDRECLEHMQHYSSVHLACHASQNAGDPLQSRFILHAGKLALGTLIQTSMKNADLAFLSACHTSAGEEKLSDEAVHLAAGMLAAGYRRVVATMWSIKDQYAPGVAKDFYEYLWRNQEDKGGDGFDGTLSAYALHHAVQLLRHRLKNSDEALLTWVPYVHFGY